MIEGDDIDALAAEYVLGTLGHAERTTVVARRQREPALDAAIVAWEQRLGPLSDLVEPVSPGAGVKAAILDAVAAGGRAPANTSSSSTIVTLERRAAGWRRAALAASALAASLAGILVYRETLRPAPAATYVAVLQKDAQSPAFLMTVDLETRSFTVRHVAAEPHAGKSYELWLVHDKLGAPKSLGVVGDQDFKVGLNLAAYAKGDIESATYAVTVEPEGGSPTGGPTGPVVYAGKLVQAKR
jgi:anti-sigma-K factor RskA